MIYMQCSSGALKYGTAKSLTFTDKSGSAILWSWASSVCTCTKSSGLTSATAQVMSGVQWSSVALSSGCKSPVSATTAALIASSATAESVAVLSIETNNRTHKKTYNSDTQETEKSHHLLLLRQHKAQLLVYYASVLVLYRPTNSAAAHDAN